MANAQLDRLLRLAIAQRRLVSLTYQGCPRIGEPHDYGARNGKDQVNFFQAGGVSRSSPLPTWRTLDATGITLIEVLDQHFAGTRETPSGRHLKWDRLYATVTPR